MAYLIRYREKKDKSADEEDTLKQLSQVYYQRVFEESEMAAKEREVVPRFTFKSLSLIFLGTWTINLFTVALLMFHNKLECLSLKVTFTLV